MTMRKSRKRTKEKLVFIRVVQAFTCHGGGWGGSAAFQFYSLDFFITHRFFVTFFPKESNVSFVPLILSPRYCAHLPIY